MATRMTPPVPWWHVSLTRLPLSRILTLTVIQRDLADALRGQEHSEGGPP
jgi:hypothetical protein